LDVDEVETEIDRGNAYYHAVLEEEQFDFSCLNNKQFDLFQFPSMLTSPNSARL
jgi:hypothetical protein